MRLLLALDVHEHARGVFDQAVGWADKLAAPLSLAYVNTFGSYLPHIHGQALAVELESELDRIRAAERQQMQDLLDTLADHLRGDVHVVSGEPATALAELSRGYDALLVATHGRTGLMHLWMGSVTEQILRRSKVPVIVLRMSPDAPA